MQAPALAAGKTQEQAPKPEEEAPKLAAGKKQEEAPEQASLMALALRRQHLQTMFLVSIQYMHHAC